MLIAAEIGCVPLKLDEWGKTVEVDSGKRTGVPTEMADRLNSLGKCGLKTAVTRPERSAAARTASSTA